MPSSDFEPFRELVHGLLEDPCALRKAGPAHRPRLARVGVDRGVFGSNVRTGVEVGGQCARAGVVGVGAGRAQALVVDGGEGAVILGADLDRDRIARSIAGDQEAVLPWQEDFHRPSGRLCHQRGVHRVLPDLELGSEAAAHVVADHAHVRQRQAHRAGHGLLDAVHALGGVPDGEPVAVPFGHRAVRLHGCVDLVWCSEGVLDHHVGLGEAGFEVAALANAGLTNQIAAILNGRRCRIEGLVVIDDERQNLVLDLDRPDGVDGLERGLCSDHRHLLALVAAVGIEESAGELAAALVPRHVGAR